LTGNISLAVVKEESRLLGAIDGSAGHSGRVKRGRSARRPTTQPESVVADSVRFRDRKWSTKARRDPVATMQAWRRTGTRSSTSSRFATDTDLDGNARFTVAHMDIGVYESDVIFANGFQ
jgi:hypothetical protein